MQKKSFIRSGRQIQISARLNKKASDSLLNKSGGPRHIANSKEGAAADSNLIESSSNKLRRTRGERMESRTPTSANQAEAAGSHSPQKQGRQTLLVPYLTKFHKYTVTGVEQRAGPGLSQSLSARDIATAASAKANAEAPVQR